MLRKKLIRGNRKSKVLLLHIPSSEKLNLRMVKNTTNTFLLNINQKELIMKSRKVNPFDKEKVKNSKTAMDKTEKSVKPVAKDTNKTRRNMKKPMMKK
jgi:hypothetical protein